MKAKFLFCMSCAAFLINHSALSYTQVNYKGESVRVYQGVYTQTKPAYIPVSCSTCATPQYDCDSCGDVESNCAESSCSNLDFFPSVNCQCADPGCSTCNDCLSPSKCCEAFGNVGGADFQPIGCDPQC